MSTPPTADNNGLPRLYDMARRDLSLELAGQIQQGSLTADELLRCYCTLVYAQTGSYKATARQLDLDHRTVKAKVDHQMLRELVRERAAEPVSPTPHPTSAPSSEKFLDLTSHG